MSKNLSPRLRVLRTIEAQPHRFTRLRRFTMGLTIATLYAIPLFHVARFDLWSGRHQFAGRSVGPVYGIAGLVFSVLSFYVLTFALNAALGRVFCGWGCPVGEASRHADVADLARRTGRGRLGAEARAVGFALLLAGAAFLWLASPRLFIEGTASAIVIASIAIAGTAALFYWHARVTRWRFCTNWCPIGVYYSAVQTAHRFGVKYDVEQGTCTDCDLCTQACPVGLHPRDLHRSKPGGGGIAIDDFPEQNHCLVCGDCVRSCESVFRVKGTDLAPLSLSRHLKRARTTR